MKLPASTVPYYATAVFDSHGNSSAVLVQDPSDTVQVCGLKDEQNTPIYFESDYYHIETWCSENNLTLKSTTGTIEF